MNREKCEYYPCHFEGQDCRLCYCPFYPCQDFRTRGKYKAQACEVIWSCRDCDFIHRKEVADEVIQELMQICDEKDFQNIRFKIEGDKLSRIFEKIAKKYLENLEKRR
ncbi:MAG: cysteine-rich small domain-containing protein [Methanocellales archaeon]